MEVIPLVFLLIPLSFVVGLTFIAWWNAVPAIMFFLFIGVLVALFGIGKRNTEAGGPPDTDAELRRVSGASLVFSIAALLPLFVQQIFRLSEPTTGSGYYAAPSELNVGLVILGLAIGFGTFLAGMFIQGNRILSQSNIIGGLLVLLYVYVRIWELNDLARVIATGIGLGVAILIAVVKFHDKLK